MEDNLCQRCMKVFPDRYKFKRHLMRKNLCKVKEGGKDISYKEMWEGKFKDISFNEYKNNKSNGQKNEKLYICENCGKILKHSSSYYSHVKNFVGLI